MKEEMEVLFFGVDQKYRLPCSDIQEWESGFLSVFAEKKRDLFLQYIGYQVLIYRLPSSNI